MSDNDFSNEELKLISDTLAERFGKAIDTQPADIELRVYEGDRELTPCPAVYWEVKNCHFILAKATNDKYFSQFFYRNNEQFGTGKPFYDDLHNCVVTLLQVQADHELKNANAQETTS